MRQWAVGINRGDMVDRHARLHGHGREWAVCIVSCWPDCPASIFMPMAVWALQGPTGGSLGRVVMVIAAIEAAVVATVVVTVLQSRERRGPIIGQHWDLRWEASLSTHPWSTSLWHPHQ